MVISPITQDELTEAYDFVHKILSGSGTIRDLEFYKQELSKHPQLMLQAKEVGGLAGVLLASVESDHVLIGELAVSEEYRGKGVGSKLLQQLEANARSMGQKTILLGAVEDAETFYLKNGYGPELFMQFSGQDSRERLEQALKGVKEPVLWKDFSGDVAKVVLQTKSIDKALQARFRAGLGVHTQYLFKKSL
jgi:GNAT superfamily N-acetyltransferase